MKTSCRTVGQNTHFIVSELDPAYHQATRDLEFTEVEDGFARIYPNNSPHLEHSYHNFARYAEEMILQMAHVHTTPWEQALLSLLQKIEGQHIRWWLVGSAALATRGIDVSPSDIDLSVDDADAHKLGDLLLDYLIEPMQATPDWFCNWFGRAFLGMRVEWVGGVDERADTPEISDFGPTAVGRMETILWQGYELQVPPLDLQLKSNEQRGRVERVGKIKKFL